MSASHYWLGTNRDTGQLTGWNIFACGRLGAGRHFSHGINKVIWNLGNGIMKMVVKIKMLMSNKDNIMWYLLFHSAKMGIASAQNSRRPFNYGVPFCKVVFCVGAYTTKTKMPSLTPFGTDQAEWTGALEPWNTPGILSLPAAFLARLLKRKHFTVWQVLFLGSLQSTNESNCAKRWFVW